MPFKAGMNIKAYLEVVNYLMVGNLRDTLKWVYIYDYIRMDMGFNYLDDCFASQVLNMMINGLEVIYEVEKYLQELIGGTNVYVVGAGPTCFEELKSLDVEPEVLIAADGAMRCCLDAGYKPHVVVTDLDGLSIKDLRHDDVVYVVHAHGDNIDKLLNYVGFIKGRLLGTTQCVQTGRLRIYGGFTDGDRAAYLAHFFGARSIRLVGFDLRSGLVGKYSKPWMGVNSYATPTKLKKFKWAERLLNMLRLYSKLY
ncbi:MAG: 6-hydroxymethylpterin diphosphokinase MptE-like protein [Sulfolobales archaeon]